jgi:mono/diheme cytochrome c family protein
MRTGEIIQIVVIGAALLGGIAVVVSNATGPSPKAVTAMVEVPDLSVTATKGGQIYNANCVQCHGQNSAGTQYGPPLVYGIYNPGHHNDDAFYRAARKGVKQHHWPYGNMPPQPQVSRKDVTAIIAYVRELQRANGIYFQKHQM